jgi:hypothetical protein
MSCLKNIPNVHVTTYAGNTGNSFPLVLAEDVCSRAPDLYLILEQSTDEDVLPLFTQQSLYISA